MEQTQEVIKHEKSEIALSSKGVVLKTFDEMYRFATAVSKSGLAPKGMEKPETILVALQLGLEIGLTPMRSLQSIAVINNKPSIYGDAAIAMVRASYTCEYVNEHYEGEGDKLTAICKSKRKGEDEHVTTFSVEDAKKAGLWNKNSVWQQYGKRMLMMRCRSYNLRDKFADILGGYSTYEEISDYKEITNDTVEAKVDRVANTIKEAVSKVATTKVIPVKEVVAEEAKAIVEEPKAPEITQDFYEAKTLEELKELCVDNQIDYHKYEGKNTKKKLATLIFEKTVDMPSSINMVAVAPIIEEIKATEATVDLKQEFTIPEIGPTGSRVFSDMRILYNYLEENLYTSDRIMIGIKAAGLEYVSKEDMCRRASSDNIIKILASC